MGAPSADDTAVPTVSSFATRSKLRQCFLNNHKTWIIVLTPIVLSPLLFHPDSDRASRCAWGMIISGVFWATEALPLAATALLPAILFPLANVVSTKEICEAYFNQSNMLFLGGLMVAIAVEDSNLHKRVALRIALFTGTALRWVLLGFMGCTLFLSVWISNTATTAMMVPIVEAVLEEMFSQKKKTHSFSNLPQDPIAIIDVDSSRPDLLDYTSMESELSIVGDEEAPASKPKKSSDLEDPKLNKQMEKARIGCLFAVAYSANLGGTGAITSTAPNLVLMGILDAFFKETELNFASWMAFNVPGMMLNLLFSWIWLQLLFIGIPKPKFLKKLFSEPEEDGVSSKIASNEESARVTAILKKKYDALGPMNFAEMTTGVSFIMLVALWVLREPGFITGWAEYFSVKISDATPAIFIVFFLFACPAEPDFGFCGVKPKLRKNGQRKLQQSKRHLLEWKSVHEKLAWNVIVLLGGGFAMSSACTKSGLAAWLGNQLSRLSTLSPPVVLLILTTGTAFFTELVSNTATAAILLPVIPDLADKLGVHPLYLMLPITVTCSYAFMLPIATPPNAIVHAVVRTKPQIMGGAGLMMNAICILTINFMMNFYGPVIFNLEYIPAYDIHNGTSSVFNLTSNVSLPSTPSP